MNVQTLSAKRAIAAKVDKIVTLCNGRYMRAMRAYNANPSKHTFAKVLHYAKDQDTREARLLSFLKFDSNYVGPLDSREPFLR